MNFDFENETTEFKREYTDSIKKEVVAFANTRGGVIYVGVDDKGEIYPIEDVDKTLQKLTNTIRDSICPDITFFIKYDIEDNKILRIVVNEGSNKPYFLKDKGLIPAGVYVRQGSSSVQASYENIKQMIKLTDGISFEDERSLNQEITFKDTKLEFENRNLEFEEINKISLGIKNKDNLYTNLGLLVSNECPFSVKVAVFEGTEKMKFRNRREIKGSVFNQLNETYEFLDMNNKLPAKIVGTDRIEVNDYPKEAIREALVNAIVHRDYSLGGSTIINIYDDRMEFVSIGGIVKGLEESDLFSGLSLARNEKLANIFFRLKYIESYGTGLKKIMKLYENYSTKPDIKIFPNAFVITLPNINYSYAFNFEIVDDKHKKILEYIKINKYITSKDVQKMLGVKSSRAYKIIKDMKDLCLIENSLKKGCYIAKL